MNNIPAIRASSLSKIMTEPRSKADKDAGLMSETAKTHLIDLAKEYFYGVKFGINSKYIQKGIECEQDSINLFNEYKGLNCIKNTERREKNGLTGEPDLILTSGRHGVDVKTAWSLQTFPAFSHEIDAKSYEYQARAYMALFDCDSWEIAYCLVNTPSHMITYMDDDEKMLHTNLDIFPLSKRVTSYVYERNLTIEAKILEKVAQARVVLSEYIEELEGK